MKSEAEKTKDEDALDSQLKVEFEALRREEVPDRLVMLARALQQKLRDVDG